MNKETTIRLYNRGTRVFQHPPVSPATGYSPGQYHVMPESLAEKYLKEYPEDWITAEDAAKAPAPSVELAAKDAEIAALKARLEALEATGATPKTKK